jgi:hypothetical protein
MPRYRIEAAMFKLAIPFIDRFVHNFWILREIESNTVIAQLHGFATSRKSGAILAVGYSSAHSLRAYSLVYDKDLAKQQGWQPGTYALRIDDSHTVYEGDDCVQRWQLAVDAVTMINSLNLDYPPFGIKFPLSATINSNSIYRTFGQIMNISVHKFAGFVHVGIKGSIYDKIKASVENQTVLHWGLRPTKK